MLHPDVHVIELAPAGVQPDPELQVTTAPFTTWVGRIRVDARNTASVLRRTGDEDLLETADDVANAIEVAFNASATAAGAPERHLVGTWLPMRSLVPMLGHLDDAEAFDVCARLVPPVVEQEPAGPGLTPALFTVRAARLDGVPGWCAALPETAPIDE